MTDGSKDKWIKIKRALISVSDKTGIVEFATRLQGLGVEIISTGGTKKVLKENDIHVIPISSFTGAPEILGGRVKTLHPAVHAGLLHKRDDENHLKEMKEQNYKAIDMVILNLYPFEQTVQKEDASEDEIIENIDIGGPTMLRAAAKAYQYVAIVTDPSQYSRVIEEIEENTGSISFRTRQNLAREAFCRVSQYDNAISNYFNCKGQAEAETDFPSSININVAKVTDLRYGENPHQKAALYKDPGTILPSLTKAEVLSGKALSYNNYTDLEAVLSMLMDFHKPFAVVVKHQNPCGAAEADTLQEAYRLALDADPISAYGSIIGLNKPVDMDTALRLHETQFVECILAPDYDEGVVEKMKKKKARRILRLPRILEGYPDKFMQYSFIKGGLLAMDPDLYEVKKEELKVVTEIQPTEDQIESLLFAFKVVKHIKSNAILLVQGKQTVGVGCGQTSRVDAAVLAAMKAKDRAKGSCLASDAFFPMRDGVDEAARAGVQAIIQPGGSKRDEEAIQAANEHKIAMVFTGIRHFKH
ncbi:MAG TPA: bifunctional phosphoribosylaminoimidazolecarboxamide formyltransferase/IMP cyclohydrolase [candidate division Zixibacteria bacterium]|nr:bifunctional phosphoribosylaminoimidazolecarboxamide formyltransferase/IMP cyclohydrolase [candidate division Zixibacteria bacterium]